MKRLLVVSSLVLGVVAAPSVALANDIEVGNCNNGRLATVSNSNQITGDTRVIICRP